MHNSGAGGVLKDRPKWHVKNIFLPIFVCIFDVITNEITLFARPKNYNMWGQTDKQTENILSNKTHSASGNKYFQFWHRFYKDKWIHKR